MRCKYCGIENNDNAQFCRNCGKEISRGEYVSINVMDKFPNYNFVPTNFYDWRKPWFARIRSFLVCLLLICSVGLMLASIIDFFVATGHDYNIFYEDVEEYDKPMKGYYVWTSSYTGLAFGSHSDYNYETAKEYAFSEKEEQIVINVVVGICLPVIFGVMFYFSRRSFPEKDNHLSNYADYVEKYNYTGFIKGRRKPILKFYVKDNKMGLLDVAHYRTFLSAQYDKLSWREKNKYLNATVGNREFIVDIYGKELK